MSDHVDQVDNVTMYEARVYVDGEILNEHGWDAPQYAQEMSDSEVLAQLDESYPGGAAGFVSERIETES
jgi:hypothetical protein